MRYYALIKGRQCAIRGRIKRVHQGELEILAEGRAADLQHYIDLLSEGTPHVTVSNIQILPHRKVDFSRLEIELSAHHEKDKETESRHIAFFGFLNF